MVKGYSITWSYNKAVDSIPEGSPERATFEANFKADVAAALTESTSMPVTLQIIAIKGITKSSLVVDFRVLAPLLPADPHF